VSVKDCTRKAPLELPLSLETRPPKRISSRDPVGNVHHVVGLFAGIGGLELGLHRAGHRAILLCESDPAARAVLRTRFAASPLDDDVRSLRNVPPDTSLIAAGFPCQDLSQAGMTRGIEGAQSGLVGEVLRLVEQHRTPWVLLENVPFMLQLSRGRAMSILTAAFEALGYKWAYRIVDARAFGLPQRRRRVYFLASRIGDPRTVLFADEAQPDADSANHCAVACGFYWTEGVRGLGWAIDCVPTLKGGSGVGIPSSPAIVLPNGNVVTLDIRDAERLQGFSADWTRPAEAVSKRGTRWRLVGNAVSVPAARWIGRRMLHPRAALSFITTPFKVDGTWPTAAWNVGDGRVRVTASEFPVRYVQRPLQQFLKYPPIELSAKATAGFLRRTERANLRFPPGFLDTLKKHLLRMQAESNDSSSSETGTRRVLLDDAPPVIYAGS
jgi:DNA (cytosine-5)-methyltransferase 1